MVWMDCIIFFKDKEIALAYQPKEEANYYLSSHTASEIKKS